MPSARHSLIHGTVSLPDDIEDLLNGTNPLSVGTLIWVLRKLNYKSKPTVEGPSPLVLRMTPSLVRVTMASNMGLVARIRDRFEDQIAWAGLGLTGKQLF